MRIAFATSSALSALTPDDQLAAAALARRGVDVLPAVWDDATLNWSDFDLVVLRSMWDYHLKPTQFFRWLDTLEASGARVVNPLDLVRWNADKRYLRDLACAGVPAIPTAWIEPGDRFDLRAHMHTANWDEVILKPVVSAGGHKTLRFSIADSDAANTCMQELLAEGSVMAQEYQPEIVSDGEWSLIFIDGAFSHAVVKRAASGEFRVQAEHGGTTEAVEAPPALVAQARSILEAVRYDWLYARVDGVRTPDGFRLMELELLEPGLFFSNRPEATECFAEGILRRLG